jgi:hypothetical protein
MSCVAHCAFAQRIAFSRKVCNQRLISVTLCQQERIESGVHNSASARNSRFLLNTQENKYRE